MLGGQGGTRRTEIAIHADFGDAVVMHQRFNACALLSSVLEFNDLRPRQFLLPAEVYATLFGFLNAIHLPFGAYFGLKLSNRAEHVKQETTGGIAGIDVLIEDVQVDLLARQGLRNLTEMPRRAC
jgi:hypothetical protein